MLVEYIGNKKDYILKPPYVEEKTVFQDNQAEIPDDFAKDLVANFPKTFREIEQPVPEKLTEKYLNSLTGKAGRDLMEKIGIDRFGVDLNKSEGKQKLIESLLELQKQATAK